MHEDCQELPCGGKIAVFNVFSTFLHQSVRVSTLNEVKIKTIRYMFISGCSLLN